MEILPGCNLLHIQIFRIKMVIRAGVDQETAVAPRNGYDDRVGRFVILRYDEIGRCAAPYVCLTDHMPECIIPDLRHQGHIRSQDKHGKAGIGYTASRGCICTAYLPEFARPDHFLQCPPLVIFHRKCRSDVHGYITCCNHFALRHMTPSLFYYSSRSARTSSKSLS